MDEGVANEREMARLQAQSLEDDRLEKERIAQKEKEEALYLAMLEMKRLEEEKRRKQEEEEDRILEEERVELIRGIIENLKRQRQQAAAEERARLELDEMTRLEEEKRSAVILSVVGKILVFTVKFCVKIERKSTHRRTKTKTYPKDQSKDPTHI